MLSAAQHSRVLKQPRENTHHTTACVQHPAAGRCQGKQSQRTAQEVPSYVSSPLQAACVLLTDEQQKLSFFRALPFFSPTGSFVSWGLPGNPFTAWSAVQSRTFPMGRGSRSAASAQSGPALPTAPHCPQSCVSPPTAPSGPDLSDPSFPCNANKQKRKETTSKEKR